MRGTLLALVVAVPIAAVLSAQSGNDREREGLVGPVRVLRGEYVHATRGDDGYKQDGQPRPLGTVTYGSAKMDFSEPDAAPTDLLNRAIWHSVKGYDTPYPRSDLKTCGPALAKEGATQLF